MIEVMRDENKNIVAVCEWLTFSDDGKLDDAGTNIFIDRLEKNPVIDGKLVIKEISRRIYKKVPFVKYVFLFRGEKYDGSKYRRYTVEQIMRRAV